MKISVVLVGSAWSGRLHRRTFPLRSQRRIVTSEPPHQDSHSTLYIATFRVITSDWRKYKHSLETPKILLHAVASDEGIVHRFNYPTYITDGLLSLFGSFSRRSDGPRIEKAVQRLSLPDNRPGIQEFRAKALTDISRFRASSS